ncbi:MAG: DUF1801 domain-containing protein [Planctomycetota bacterium]|nr:DUF1801 domain-containing protein [Planctomycetota bacterium]
MAEQAKKKKKKKAKKKSAGASGGRMKKAAPRPTRSGSTHAFPSKAPASATRRSDYGEPGHVAIDRLPEPHRSIARAADAMIVRAVKGCESVVKWGNACYFKDGVAFAALARTKKGINLVLPGVGLDDPHGLLEGSGAFMRHIKLHDADMATRPGVAALVKQAVGVGFERM